MMQAQHTNHWQLKLSVLLIALITSTGVLAQNKKIDCECRAPDGTMRKLGAVECVDIVGTQQLVRCEMSTNTPYWKKLEGVTGCPDA